MKNTGLFWNFKRKTPSTVKIACLNQNHNLIYA